ncbi:efflux transporter outer membrane subunit [Caballeronia sp. LZ043]|uniref:efflux transporter outer membrane subunit n=1 Tax=Caballeronia sp. LZ043 TaxID=3038569 RepID=UPI0028546D1B|nr:efflux transporter outer membrane subunit [Caballeronia sp. LZ043]MDR5826204.1 efflux transporter outer membrane subunit [Caballeronia sp. LZ043]
MSIINAIVRSNVLCAAAFLSSIANLTACSVIGPDYSPPHSAYPENWASSPRQLAPASSADIQAWWKLFNDPILDSLVEAAIKNNQDLAVAEQRLVRARAERVQIASHLLPSVDIDTGAQAMRSNTVLNPLGVGHTRVYSLGLDASWEIDVFGERRRTIEAADAEIQAVAEERHAVLVSLLAELASEYAALRATQLRTQIAQGNVEILTLSKQFAERAFQRGVRSSVEVAQARTELDLADAKLPVLNGDTDRLIHTIGVLTGGFPGDLLDTLRNARSALVVPPTIPQTVPSEMVRQRPDIREAERELASATARIGVAQAERFPKFAIPLTIGTAAGGIGDLLSSVGLGWTAAITSVAPLIDGGSREAGVQAAEANVEAKRLAYERTVRRAFLDVEDARTGLIAEFIRQKSLTAAVSDSQTAQKRVTQLYTRGLSSYVSVLTAQRTAFEAQDALALCQLARVQHVIGLYKALGAGWREPSITKISSR